MSSITGLISGGGGGTPINGVSRFNKTDASFTDNQGQVWLKTGNLITSGFATYPDADITNGLMSLASYTGSSIYVGNLTVSPVNVEFSPNGLSMYVCEISSGLILHWTLTTPFDLSTATYAAFLNVSAQTAQPHSLKFSDDGLKAFVVGADSNNIFQYSMANPYGISGAVYQKLFAAVVSPTDVDWSIDGKSIFMYSFSSRSIYQYPVKTPFDISSIGSPVNELNFNTLNSVIYTPYSFEFNSDGTILYVLDIINTLDRWGIYEFKLRSPYDISEPQWTGGYFNLSGQMTTPRGFFIKRDDLKMYTIGTGNDRVYEYNLGQAIGQPLATDEFDYIRIK